MDVNYFEKVELQKQYSQMYGVNTGYKSESMMVNPEKKVEKEAIKNEKND